MLIGARNFKFELKVRFSVRVSISPHRNLELVI